MYRNYNEIKKKRLNLPRINAYSPCFNDVILPQKNRHIFTRMCNKYKTHKGVWKWENGYSKGTIKILN